MLLKQCSPECLLPALLSSLVLRLVFNGAQWTKPDKEIPPGSILHLPLLTQALPLGQACPEYFFFPKIHIPSSLPEATHFSCTEIFNRAHPSSLDIPRTSASKQQKSKED